MNLHIPFRLADLANKTKANSQRKRGKKNVSYLLNNSFVQYKTSDSYLPSKILSEKNITLITYLHL